jgi:hypothetical protein
MRCYKERTSAVRLKVQQVNSDFVPVHAMRTKGKMDVRVKLHSLLTSALHISEGLGWRSG